MTKGPLEGVRVADFTWIGAGAYTTKLLSDFGANVIKVETSTHMDTVRSNGPFKDGIKGTNRSGYFADRNTSKRGMVLNLKQPRAREVAERLIRWSDILANNFRPGVMDRLGLGYKDAARVRPDIIYLAMSMQGSQGPHADYVGFGLTMGALTGLHHLCGPAERAPAGTSTNFPDHAPNPTHGAFALLAALHHRRQTGQGQLIDFSQIEPMVSLLGTGVVEYTANGRVAERAGNDHQLAVPHGVFRCRGEDRWITMSIYGDDDWRAAVGVLSGPGAALDIPWPTFASRSSAKSDVLHWVEAHTAGFEAEDLMRQLQRVGVTSGVVQNARDLIEADPQLAHRSHWQFLDHPEMGRTLYNGLPIQLSRTPGKLSRPAPLLGQHTKEICMETLGYSKSEFESLKQDGVFE